jgi:hypothetical protein
LSQFFTKLRPFPSKSEKTVFAANAKYFRMQEARENGQNFKTSSSNSPPRYQMLHHMEDLERQIPYSLEKTWSQIPGVCRGGGMMKFRIDRYITHIYFRGCLHESS